MGRTSKNRYIQKTTSVFISNSAECVGKLGKMGNAISSSNPPTPNGDADLMMTSAGADY